MAFDRPEPTFRDEVVADYKGNRPDTPDLLVPQFALVREVLGALAVECVEKVGFEADDILATLATQARRRRKRRRGGDRRSRRVPAGGGPPCEGHVHPEGDLGHRRVRRGGDLGALRGPGALYPLLAALRGDVSDNLPGVPGVGEKTAAKLITTYGDLDGIFEHAAELSPKLRQNLLDHEAQVRANAAVIPLVRDVPLQVGVDDLGVGRWDAEKVKGVFAELELRSLWQRLAPIVGGGEEKLPRSSTAPPGLEVDLTGVEVVSPGGSKAASDALRRVAGQGVAVALYPSWVGDPGRSKLTGLAVAAVPDPASAKDGASPELSALWLDEEAVADEAVLRALGALVGQGGAGVMAHGAKELMRSLLPLGADVTGLDMDTAVAAYLLDPSSGRYKLEEVLDARLGLALGVGEPAPAGQLDLGTTENGENSAGCAQGAMAVGLLVGPLREALRSTGLERLYDEVERPLVRVLARMEVTGIRVDVAELKRIAKELVSECDSLEAQIQELAGHELQRQLDPAAADRALRASSG